MTKVIAPYVGGDKTHRHDMLDKELFPILLSRSRDQVVVHFDDSPRCNLDKITNDKLEDFYEVQQTCSGVRLDTNGVFRGSCILLLMS